MAEQQFIGMAGVPARQAGEGAAMAVKGRKSNARSE